MISALGNTTQLLPSPGPSAQERATYESPTGNFKGLPKTREQIAKPDGVPNGVHSDPATLPHSTLEIRPSTFSEAQLTEAHRRERLVTDLAILEHEGQSLNAAALSLGEPAANLSRYRSAFRRGGFAALVPKFANSGRKPLATLSPAHVAEVQRLVLQTDPNTGTRISTSMALRLFAHGDTCPDDVAEAILKPRSSKHTVTPTLKRQARVSAESKMLDRGEKTFALGGALVQPRALTWIDPAGGEKPILAGDIFERDDMTLNQPWYVEWEGGDGDACAEKFGVKLLRGQLLVQIDVASQRILSFELLARPHDSYRADDIWAWIGRGYRDLGLPRVGERMERGIWEANAIHGVPILAGAWEQKQRLGGLAALGVRHIPSFSPRTKSIEALFNVLQKVLGCTGVQVGRKRGEYEKANRDWLLCRAGKKHPADAGFLHADDLVNRIANACAFLNQDRREGEVYKGVPDELWTQSIAAQPLAGLPAHQAWVFMPQKREAAIRGGMVRCRFAEQNCSFWFCNPELFAQLGRGYRVIVCFDPAMPDLGAVIFNNEAGARAVLNGHAVPPGAQLGVAELVERVPQYCALDGFDDEAGYDRRRRFSAQCRKAYRAIALPGARGSAATIARDIRGNEVRIEKNFTAHRSNEAAGTSAEPHAMRTRGAASAAPRADFDEAAALARVDRLEAEAIARGDIFLT